MGQNKCSMSARNIYVYNYIYIYICIHECIYMYVCAYTNVDICKHDGMYVPPSAVIASSSLRNTCDADDWRQKGAGC